MIKDLRDKPLSWPWLREWHNLQRDKRRYENLLWFENVQLKIDGLGNNRLPLLLIKTGAKALNSGVSDCVFRTKPFSRNRSGAH